MIKTRLLPALAALVLAVVSGVDVAVCAAAQEKSKAELERLLRLLPQTRGGEWEKWLKQSSELPPDFDKLPRHAGLPDPLVRKAADGKQSRITEAKDWEAQRNELLSLIQRYVTGAFPSPPGNVHAMIRSTRQEPGATVQDIVLEFGPDHRASLAVELFIPRGKGPFPVFLTQWNHRGWALIAASRGYVACVYAGADSKDDTGAFIPIWPQHDWTKLMRRAWAAGRCIDYLETLAFVDKTKIAITGHSRNGKQSLMAAAFDPRISAVISSSSGAGGACTYRFFSEAHFGEGIEFITRNFPDWLHPRLRFFAGREDRLPVDQHDLLACIAPRACLIATALNDNVESTWAIQQTYLAVKPVYELLGAAERLRIDWRPGIHGTRAADIERYLDWFDTQFGRSNRVFPEVLLHPRYEDWLRLSGETVNWRDYPQKGIDDLLLAADGKPIQTADQWRTRRDEIVKPILWALGDPPAVAVNPGGAYGGEAEYMAQMLGRSAAPSGIEKQTLNFGNYVAGDIYAPTDATQGNRQVPAVIWLHPVSHSNGYVAGYRRGERHHIALAQQTGAAVFAFDQIGHGARIEEATRFYERYPHWSLLGKMVADVRAAVDVLVQVPYVDPKRIYVLGYSMGAVVGLHAAALDERIAGVVSVAGFAPMRLGPSGPETGGVARWSQWHCLQPRLGAFVGHENHVPYDYHEVLALIAPRPLLVVTPQGDIENSYAAVQEALREVGKVYELTGARQNLSSMAPDDYNRYPPELQQQVNAALKKIVAPK